MTEIRSIHGINRSEFSDRGRLVSANAPYIPYTSMTKGEMNLALLNDEALVYAAAYPDFPAFRKAAEMYSNALRAGVSGGVNFVGALHDPILQRAAQNIKNASRQTAPAAKVITNRSSLLQGVRIGEAPIYTGQFDHDCVQYATKAANAHFGRNKPWTWWEKSLILSGSAEHNYWTAQKSICATRVAIEKIMNDNMVNTSHHILYKSLSDSFKNIIGSQVLTKKILHVAGVGGLSNVSDVSMGLMNSWAETGVLRKNASTGAGVLGSIDSSLSIAPDPGAMVAAYNDFLAKNPDKNPKFDKITGTPQIGVVVATLAAIGAIVTAIGAAIASSAEFQKQLNAKKQGALATVQGYGTAALEAKGTDYLTPGDVTSTSNSKALLIGGAALAAYLLMSDK